MRVSLVRTPQIQAFEGQGKKHGGSFTGLGLYINGSPQSLQFLFDGGKPHASAGNTGDSLFGGKSHLENYFQELAFGGRVRLFCREHALLHGNGTQKVRIKSSPVILYTQQNVFPFAGDFTVQGAGRIFSHFDPLVRRFQSMVHCVTKYMHEGFCEVNIIIRVNIKNFTLNFKGMQHFFKTLGQLARCFGILREQIFEANGTDIPDFRQQFQAFGIEEINGLVQQPVGHGLQSGCLGFSNDNNAPLLQKFLPQKLFDDFQVKIQGTEVL